MIIADDLIARVRGEYREMPGMRLTFAQACRLWHMDTTTCNAVLGVLLAEGFLHQCSDGTYTSFRSDETSVAFPARRPTPAKHTLPEDLSDEGPCDASDDAAASELFRACENDDTPNGLRTVTRSG